MTSARLPALGVALFGTVLVTIGFIWQQYSEQPWESIAPLYNLLLFSGWSLIIIGWIGRAINMIFDHLDDIRRRIATLDRNEGYHH